MRVKEVAAQPVLSIHAVVPRHELVRFFDEACDEMYEYLDRIGTRPAGPPMSLWHSAPGEIENASAIQTCIPVERAVPSQGRMQAGELPAGQLAYTIHVGPYDDMGQAFEAVWSWIQTEGHETVGPPRDVILAGSRDTDDPAEYRTEKV